MPLAHALLAAALAAGAGGPPVAPGEALARSFPRDAALGAVPSGQLRDVVVEALPPAPAVVVRETRYYGTVTVDHRAHLARRARCATCHDPGPIAKLSFTPKVAHDRCVGCHRQQAAGPTDCKGCHVRKPPEPQPVVPCAPAEAPPAAPDATTLAARIAELERRHGDDGVFGREPFHRALTFGLAVGAGQGPAVRVASHLDRIVVTQSVERMMSSGDSRTIGLLGAGYARPVHSGVALEALALAGFDAIDRPLLAMLPAVGLRTGLEWRTRKKWFQHVGAAVTVLADLSTRSAAGREVGGTTVYGTVATGFSFPPK